MIIAKDNGQNFPKLPLPEAGTAQAVCCGVWDLGLQKTSYKGVEKIQHKIIIAWELAEKIDAPDSEFHGKPYMLSKKYTLSLGEQATLRKDLESWRGKAYTPDEVRTGIDLEKLYGINCFLGVTHKSSASDPSKVYANISAILPMTKGVEKIAPVRLADDEPPKWVQEKRAEQVLPQNVEDFLQTEPDFGENPFI